MRTRNQQNENKVKQRSLYARALRGINLIGAISRGLNAMISQTKKPRGPSIVIPDRPDNVLPHIATHTTQILQDDLLNAFVFNDHIASDEEFKEDDGAALVHALANLPKRFVSEIDIHSNSLSFPLVVVASSAEGVLDIFVAKDKEALASFELDSEESDLWALLPQHDPLGARVISELIPQMENALSTAMEHHAHHHHHHHHHDHSERLHSGPYRNGLTLYQAPVGEIPADKFIELDNYAFDVDELLVYAQQEGKLNPYRNPYLLQGNAIFSEAARSQIAAHPVLAPYVTKINLQLATQQSKISARTVDAVMQMLHAFEKPCTEEVALDYTQFSNSEDQEIPPALRQSILMAKLNFLEYKNTLSAQAQSDLDDYIIVLFSRADNDESRMTFKAAFKGGDDGCMMTTKIFCWQFAVNLRPAVFAEIPPSVSSLVARTAYKITRPSTAPANIPTIRQYAPPLARISSFTDAFFNSPLTPAPRSENQPLERRKSYP